MLDVLVVTPFDPGGLSGNAVTARRWAGALRRLGARVEVTQRFEPGAPVPDVLVALHARRSAASIAAYRAAAPDRPLVVTVTGTDVYGDLEARGDDAATALRSLFAATRIVALQSAATDALPAELRGRVRVIPQAAETAGVDPARAPLAGRAPEGAFLAAVLGHLRDVKDPLRAAAAARLLPEDSRVHVVHVGDALEPGLADAARAEDRENPRYTWLGPLPHAEALAVLARADVHVITSRSEGGANALSEALQLGVPTLTSAIPGCLGLLGADYPATFPVGDEAALARLLRRSEIDADFLADLRRRTRALSAAVAPGAELDAWRALLDELGLLAAAAPAPEHPRLEWIADAPRDVHADFADDVAAGLGGDPKELPCRWLYDAEGSRLFEEICGLDEYYPTRAEAQILRTHAPAIVAACRASLEPDVPVTCVELGSGSGEKSRHVLDAFLAAQPTLTYVPVDISRSAVEACARELLAELERLRVVAIAGEYGRGFEWLSENPAAPKLVLWLGGNIGNLDREGAAAFLADLRGHLGPRDRVLVGIDLRKDRAVLESAYDDPRGVTERFIKNVLVRMNRELDADVRPDDFDYEARYDEEAGRVVMHLVARRDLALRVGALDATYGFTAGERMHVEDSTKYSPAEIDALAAAAGFEIAGQWLDDGRRFSDTLLAPV